MKKIFLSVLILLSVCVTVSAQKISYQAVVRDSHNRLVVNTNVNVAVTITYGTGTYTESLNGMTNANGLMSLEIGGASGFGSIDWRDAWIKTVITIPGEGTVEDMVQVTATPLALYANYAADISPNAPTITAIYSHIGDTLGHYPTTDVLKDTAANIRSALIDTAAAIRADMAAAQVNSDWNATSGVEEILNKPDLSVYATNVHLNDTLGYYTTINALKDTAANVRSALVDTAAAIRADMAAAQVNSDWNATSGVEEILNKPDLSVYATNAHLNDTLSHYPTSEVLIDTAAAIRNALVDTAAAIRANIPVVNNGAITVTRNGADVTNGTFTVDQNTNQTIDIAVPTTVAELTDAADYAKVAADNNFTGTNTVPSGFDIDTTNSTNCGNVVVNACDLFAVFDSLNRRISALEDALDALMHAVPPTVTVSLSDISSNSMKAIADANDNGTAITAYEFCISVNSDMSAATCYSATTANYTFTGLDAYTTYYVTASATNLAGTGTSSMVNARTPAHAPTGILSSSLPAKPTGFLVTVNSLDFKEPAEGTVQIFYKKGSDCSADEDGFTAWPVSGTLATGADYTQNLTGLEPTTAYCVMVKLTNVDSSTTYGPVNATSGEDIRLIITPETPSLSLCEGATVDDNFTAAPNFGDVEEYSYEWSDGTNTYTTNPVTMTFNTTGVKTIICVATHQTEGYIITDTVDITVASAGTAPSFSVCENMLVVDISDISTDVISFNWGDGSALETPTSPWPIDPTWWKPWHAYAAPGGTYDIVATNESGCTATQTVSLGRPVLNPCTGLSAHEGGVYAGQGYGGADDGREYADENGIYAVTDYDGNVYPVVKIGSQCWMAENLRTEHSPSTGSQILLGKENTYGIDPSSRVSFTSKMAVWASLTQAGSSGVTLNKTVLAGYYSEIVPRLGLLYNWCAAVDTFNTAYAEVSNAKQTTTGWKPVLNMVNGNRRGICPRGWHLPSADEWDAMLESAGVVQRTGTSGSALGSGAGKLVMGCYWKSTTTAGTPGDYAYDERNSSGFSALPGGSFNHQYSYYPGINNTTNNTYFWTSTQPTDNKQAIRYSFQSSWTGIKQDANNKYLGSSVRCVRD